MKRSLNIYSIKFIIYGMLFWCKMQELKSIPSWHSGEKKQPSHFKCRKVNIWEIFSGEIKINTNHMPTANKNHLSRLHSRSLSLARYITNKPFGPIAYFDMHATFGCISIQSHCTHFEAINSNSFHSTTICSRILFHSFTCKYVDIYLQCSFLISIQWYNECMTFGCGFAYARMRHFFQSLFINVKYYIKSSNRSFAFRFMVFISIFAAVKANCVY